MKRIQRLISSLVMGAALVVPTVVSAQCYPTGTPSTHATFNATNGATQNITGIPTGTAIQVVTTAPNTEITVDMCAVNQPNTPDGINDSQITLFDAADLATPIGFIDDGCTTNVPNGWGPSTGSWIIAAPGTYLIYVTEWTTDGVTDCIADGLNTSYVMDISSTVILAPANDDCANAVSLIVGTAACSLPLNGNTLGGTQSAAPSACSGFTGDSDDDVWYSFVATGTDIQVEAQGLNGFDGVLDVWDGTCSTGVTLSCADATVSDGLEVVLLSGLTVGNTYYARVYSYGDATAAGEFTICAFTKLSATNDDCATAISLSVAPDAASCSPTNGTTIGATESAPGSNCGGFDGDANDDVWFSFTATSPYIGIDVQGANGFDAVIDAWDSCNGATIACSDVASDLEQLELNGLTVGNTYVFRVYSWDSTFGDFTVCVYDRPTPPANDDCSSAIALTVAANQSACVSTTYTTVGASESLPTADCNGFGGTSDDDVFFSFVATASVHGVALNATDGVFDAVIDVLDGCAGTSLACADDGIDGDPESMVLSGLTVGSTYYVRVYSWGGNGAEGEFDLCVYSIPAVDLGVKGIGTEYSVVPDFEVPVAGLPVSAVLQNVGSANQTATVTANVYLLPNTTTPVQTLTSAATSITAQSEVVVTLGNFTQSVIGNYEIDYNVTITGDADLSNNDATTNLEISNQAYARDDENLVDGLGVTSGEVTQAQSYDIYSPAQILSVDFTIQGGSVGDTIQAVIYDTDASGMPNTVVGSSNISTLTSAAPGLVNMPITPVYTASTSGKYVIGLYHKSTGANIALGYSEAIYTPGACWINGTFNGTWEHPEDYGFEVAYSIRPNLKQVVGIAGENFESFEIYPNPTEGLFTLNYALKKSSDVKVEVMDVSGRVVASFSEKTEAAKHSIDLSEVAAGVYTVRFSVDGQATFHKLVVR